MNIRKQKYSKPDSQEQCNNDIVDEQAESLSRPLIARIEEAFH
jgi:hypothetical protein